MVVKSKRSGGSVLVELIGELDHHCALTVKQELDKLIMDTNIRELILDLGGLRFMDSSGIGVLMGRYKNLIARGGKVCVKNVNSQVERIFSISGLWRIIQKVG